jgi:hypothetical protein
MKSKRNQTALEKQTEVIRYSRNECLLNGDPTKVVIPSQTLGLYHEETLSGTMTEIGNLLRYGYEFGGNPLEMLRKYHPLFEWQWYEIENDVKKLAGLSASADYIWSAHTSWGDWFFHGIVRCRLFNPGFREPKKIFLCPQLSLDSTKPDLSFWPMEELRHEGCRFVFGEKFV